MKKPKKGEAKSLFGSIKQTPPPIQDPLKTEKFYSDDGERITRITYRLNPTPVEVSADKLMKAASEMPSVLIPRNLWHFILPWLDNTEERIRKFWEHYRCEAAETGRKIAIEGSKSSNRQNELNLLNIAHEYKALSIKNYGFDLKEHEHASLLVAAATSEAERDAMMEALKEKMVNWLLNAIWNDQEAPKRLHQLLTDNKAAKSEYKDQLTLDCRFFNAFVQELTEHWRLPTKKAVRTRAGRGGKESDPEAAVIYRTLGLNELPQG